MPVITVKGLGQVRIEGDVPTEAERQNMLAEIERRSEPAIPESVQETLSPLTQLQEGFAGSRDYRTERSLPEQAVRGLGSTALELARGLPELFAATTEVATDAAMDEPIRPERLFQGSPASRLIEMMRPRARQAAEDIEEVEREMYTASETVPSEAWESLLEDPSRMGRFIVEGVAGSLPHYVATLASPAGYAAALVGDIAKERARREGRDKLNVKDLGVAIPAAASISGLNRAAQLVGLGGPAGAGIISAGIRNALAETGTEIPQGVIDVLARGGGGEEVKESVIGAATIAPVLGFGTGALRAKMRPASPEVAPVTEESVTPVTEGAVAPTEEVVAASDYTSRPSPREQVEADTDVAVRRVEANRARAEQIDAVPTRPRTGEVEPITTQAQAQAELDQADVDVDNTASDPSSSLADVVERQAHAAGLRSNANNASNADTRAFLEEIHPDDPGRVRQIMSQERVPVSQALAELQARNLHTRTPDDLTVETTAPFKAMIDDIIATGRNADHVEKLAFGHAKVQHQRVYRNLLREYDKADTPQARKDLSEKIDRVRRTSDEIALADAKAQRAWGLSGIYSQFFLDKDLNLSEAIAKAKVDNGRSELEPKQREFIENEFAASDRLEARAKPLRDAGIKRMKALSRVIRRLEGKDSLTDRDIKLLKEARRRYDKAEGVVIGAEADIRAAKSIRLQAPKKAFMNSYFRKLTDISDVSRSLRSSGEDSSLGRQGMSLVWRQMLSLDTQWLSTIPPALKILGAGMVNNPAGRARARRMQQELVNQPYQAAYDLAGGELVDVEGVSGAHGGTMDSRQEEFAANLFNRMGGFGRAVGERLIEPSQNAYALTLNLLRRHYFDQALTRRLKYEGIPTDLSATELTSALKGNEQLLDDVKTDAYMASVFTGRGKFKLANPTGDDFASMVARGLLYAPKYTASLIESGLYTVPSAVLTAALTRRSYTKPFNYKNYPEWFKKLKNREYDPRVEPLRMAGFGPFKNVSDYQRGRLLTESVKEIAWLTSLATLSLLGADDSDETVIEKLGRFLDPSSPDFGKYTNGNWHIGMDSRAATLRHILPYGVTPDEAGEYLTVDPAKVDVLTRLGRLARNKLTPLVQGAIGTGTNEDYLGNQVTDQTYEEAKDTVDGLLKHLGQRSIPLALSFTPIIAESLGNAFGEGMGETGVPGLVPPDPAMANPDAPSLLNKMLITGGANMFGIGVQYYDPESGDANLPPELRSLLRSADPARALRPPSLP